MTTTDFLERIAAELHEMNATLSVQLDQIEEQLHHIVESFTDLSVIVEDKS